MTLSEREKPSEQQVAITPKQETFVQLFVRGDQKKHDLYASVLVKYWKELEGFKRNAEQEIKEYGTRSQRSMDDDKETACELVKQLLEHGIFPVISIPQEHAGEKLASGIKARKTWIPGLEVNVGTIGIPPYLPPEQSRVLFEVRVADPDGLEPRLTGDLKTFQGVVAFRGKHISPSWLTEIQL